MNQSSPLLLVNQTIGPLFADLVAATERRSAVRVFRGLAYRRSPAAARLGTWLAFSIQLAWHLLWRGQRYQCLLLVSNPPFAPLLAPLARRPYALLLYDLYPQVLAQLGLPQPLQRWIHTAWHRLNRLVYARAEWVFTLSPAMAEALRPDFPSEQLWRQRVRVIPPWADTSTLRPDPVAAAAFRRDQQLDPGALLLSYSGNLGLTHPLEPLVDAAALLAASEGGPPAQLLLIGHGPRRAALQQRATRLQLPEERLRFLDPLPWSALAGSLSAADLAVVALDGPAAAASLPSKTFSALACGTPLLAIAPASSALAQLVMQHRCGVVIEPGPAAAAQVAELVVRLSAQPEQLQQLAAQALAASRHYTAANAERLLDIWLGPSLSMAP